MAFNRPAFSVDALPAEILTARLVGIGFNFAATGEADADIECTLLQASVVGMEGQDLRVLGVLVTWLGIHHAHVNVDRLVRVVSGHPSVRVRAFWCAIAKWLGKDRRLARLMRLYKGARIDLLPVGNAFQVTRRGEDPRFGNTVLCVPQGSLRNLPEDVLDPAALARHHAIYRHRVWMGANWRADIWCLLSREPDCRVSDVARRVGCSFSTAWDVVQDFRLLGGMP